MRKYRSDFLDIVNKRFVLCVVMLAVLAYGFAAFNPTISVDDTMADYYYGSSIQTMLGAGRFTMTLLSVMFNYSRSLPINSFAIDILAVVFFVWAAANYCVLFRRICGERFTHNVAILFSCTLISYPLIVEIWEFTACNLNVTMGYFLDSVALLLVYEFLHGARNWRDIVLAVILLMFVCASYESLVVVYVFGVFAVLFLQVIWGEEKEGKLKTILIQGIIYAAVLLAALILKVMVHKLILTVTGIAPMQNGQREIFWLTRSTKEVVLTFLAGILSQIFLKGIIYFPITELLFSGLVFFVMGIVLCRKKGAAILLPWAGIYLSLVLLPLLQGMAPMYRTCQVYGIFVAFVFSLVGMAVEKLHIRLRVLTFGLAAFLCVHQAIYVNHFLMLNHYRSEAENHIVEEIGNDLLRGFDLEKPVIFVGARGLSDEIVEDASIPEDSLRWKLYRGINLRLEDLSPQRFGAASQNRVLPETAIQSVVSYGVYSPYQMAMHSLFSYNGYDYIPADYGMYYDSAQQYIYDNNVPAYPKAGYISDMGDCIVIYLG